MGSNYLQISTHLLVQNSAIFCLQYCGCCVMYVHACVQADASITSFTQLALHLLRSVWVHEF